MTLPETVRLKKKHPPTLLCNNHTYTLLEHEFYTEWPKDTTVSRGPFYLKEDEPYDKKKPVVYMPDIEYLTGMSVQPQVMHKIHDSPTELDEPLRTATRDLEQ
jgi:hypothetical protein